MFEVNYRKIEIVHAADGFQGIGGSACEMANTANLRQRVGYRFFQFIVVGEQKHNWRLHASTFLDRSMTLLRSNCELPVIFCARACRLQNRRVFRTVAPNSMKIKERGARGSRFDFNGKVARMTLSAPQSRQRAAGHRIEVQ